MTFRYPLVVNPTSGVIQELQTTDDIELGNSDLANVGNLNITYSANLGAVGNLTITGGSANHVLVTNGAGDVSFAITPAVGANAQVQFNNSGTLGGDAGFTYNAGTNTANIGNLEIPGIATCVGNVTAGNLVATGGVVVVATTLATTNLANGTISIDSANNKLGVYYGGSWRYATLLP
jgi:hypothetical protein